jgi:hypothetical protein
VAETVAPSVRGRQRAQVVAVLATSATATGALAGFVLGVVLGVLARWAGLVVVVAAAVLLDLVGIRPLAVGRQVPRTWTRAFSLSMAAFLYGARLGVGPLTVLNTWLWWGMAAVGAAAGVWWSTAVGALFGLTRILVMVTATRGAEVDMPRRMARVRSGERLVRLSATALALALVFAACTDEQRASSPTTTTTTTVAPASTVPPVVVDEGLLLADAGPGFARVPDDARLGLGPLDLATAAKVEADTAAERALLETRRFSGGHARAWRSADGDEAYVAVYEFADAAGASAYLRDGLVTLEGRGASAYAVENLPEATGFSQAERREAGAVTSHGVVFTRGARFFLVVLATARPGSTPAPAAALARAADARQAAQA